VDGRGEGWKGREGEKEGKGGGREGEGRKGKGACAVLTFSLKSPDIMCVKTTCKHIHSPPGFSAGFGNTCTAPTNTKTTCTTSVISSSLFSVK